ncbi:GIY-YIG nuclease family protein [Mesorhizobium sp. BH1-1-5]|uniref:GIY-YIG nuclease family protein n=1 Tax=Mesorhizobium sp. BH1-1-5 TaxID=2876661 RepID=UPI001CCCE679|nr:GIY-YIG nuclease family protein [Mesorhizobium sp. BH1-1-5]MBZ9986700.1 GIY-YIG nuclease family protein [Mesorhizobium sp. BH1-1-5]
MAKKPSAADDAVKRPPLETDELRKGIRSFFHETDYDDPSGVTKKVGSYKWGVYAFYDYDGEPIYVGQTKEKLSGRVGRHMTNQRTDAVAMSVLDPFEVAEIEVWPLPQFEGVNKKHPDFRMANAALDALEHAVFTRLRRESKFGAILNEKDPPSPTVGINEPPSVRGSIVSDTIRELRSHPDTRLARRSMIVSKLAQVISEREVKMGLRRVLVTQTKRLHWLAKRRFEALGGDSKVEAGSENDDEIDRGE